MQTSGLCEANCRSTSAEEDGILSYGRQHLAAYKMPRAIQFVEDFPKTSSGKIMRRKLHELMYYRFRRTDDAVDRFSYGAVVLPDGQLYTLGFDQVELEILDTWPSPKSGVIYPSAWRLRVPEHELDLRVRPALADQELDLSFRYWEGAVEIEGTLGASDVNGRGYVELTGYGTASAPRTW